MIGFSMNPEMEVSMKNSMTQILVLMIVSLTEGQAPPNGLIAWYSFNDTLVTGSTTKNIIKDNTTNKNDGAVYAVIADGKAVPGVDYSIISTNPDSSKSGRLSNYKYAIDLNSPGESVPEYVFVTPFKSLSSTNDSITISLWIWKISSQSSGWHDLICMQSYDINYNPTEKIRISDSSTYCQSSYATYKVPGSSYLKSKNVTSIIRDKWHHIALVWGKPVMKYYFDDNLIDSLFNDTLIVPTSTYKYLLIGAGFFVVNSFPSANIQSYFSGLIGDIRIYNRALKKTGIDSLYNECHPISTNILSGNLTKNQAPKKYKGSHYDLMGRNIQIGDKTFHGVYIETNGITKQIKVK